MDIKEFIVKEIINASGGEELTDDQKNKIIVNIPANRLGNSEDISNGCIYLASDEASYVNGATLHVNGGMVMV